MPQAVEAYVNGDNFEPVGTRGYIELVPVKKIG